MFRRIIKNFGQLMNPEQAQVEIELIPKELSEDDNTENVEMEDWETWFLKHFVKKYNPKKIVEIGISAGGNTVNLLHWKNKDAKLYSIDIAEQWYRDNSKLSGFMADELVEDEYKENWKIYRGHDYIDVIEEIGDNIDLIVIDTVHAMPGEFLTFITALPQLKDGCIVVLHDIHYNLFKFSRKRFSDFDAAEYCTGLLFSSVSSKQKWSVKDDIPNIAAFVVDETTRTNIKDIFHALCTTWYSFPSILDLKAYCEFINEHYSSDCYNLFRTCLKLQSEYAFHEIKEKARVDIKNTGDENNTIEILDIQESVDANFPNWLKTDKGQGAFIQTNVNQFGLKFKCINDGSLEISARGPDVKNEFRKRVPRYIKYMSFNVNGEEILKGNVIVWHDEPYKFEKNVKDGEIIELHFEFELV